MPLFSVIIASYNRAQFIGATLESLRAQEFTDYEVIVVDDGSTDGSLNILRSHASWLKLIKQKNAGPGAARNRGLRACTGEYIAFLDSDDLWFPWSLEVYASFVRQRDAPAFIAGKPFRFRDDLELAGVTLIPVKENVFPDYLASGSEWRWWGVSSFVIRADALRAIGGFAEAKINGEDADLALKLGVSPGFVQVTAPFTFGYREHGGNVTADLSKSLAGVWHKVRAEQSGGYPGGPARARERWRILTRHVRPVALECLRRGARRDACALYRATFDWHLRLGRWKFLAGFPLKALTS